MTQSKVGVAVLGATGYTGAELIRILLDHPHAELLALTSRQFAGQSVEAALPGLVGVSLLLEDEPTDLEEWKARGVQVVFACLPHCAFAERAPRFLQAGMRVVDLSADFRLRDAAEYPARYHFEHPAPDLLSRAVYGLPEWCAERVGSAELLANPGCYPTSILLGSLPAMAGGLWNGAPVVVNAVSGVSGAGRAPKLGTHFVECGNSVAPYKVGESHVHLGEIKQAVRELGGFAGEPPILFNPHLVPMARGIVASIAIPMNRGMGEADVRQLYSDRYANSPFVRVHDDDTLPQTRDVRGSNRCDIALRVAAEGSMLLVFSAIDNLVKGAAGQAVQNWNLMQGWAQDLGLARRAMACA